MQDYWHVTAWTITIAYCDSEILRQVYGYLTRLCDWTMPKPSVVMPDWMMDEIDDRRHSRTDRSEWIRGAIQARLDAEDRGDWDD